MLITRLLRARRANVAMITALCVVPLVGVISLAVDMGNAVAARAKLDSAADAAALLATTVASTQYTASAPNPAAAGQAAASARFLAQAGAIPGVSVATPAITVTQSGSQFTASVAYAGSYRTSFAGIVGFGTIPVGGASTSGISVNPFVDIQVLMDVSASMAIAATPADITAMQNITINARSAPGMPANADPGSPCAFACHWSSSNNDYLAMARAQGVKLRIDVLQAAVANLITSIQSISNQAYFRFGMTTFAQQFSNIYPTSSNIGGANAALSAITLDINGCTSNCPETYFTNALQNLTAITPASGNGGSQSASLKYLFIVTDGLVDEYVGNNRVIGPISPSDCAGLKAKGVTILTLYTPYTPLVPPYTANANGFYQYYVQPYQPPGGIDQIQQALMACASAPNFAFVASNAAQINSQLQQLLATVVQTSSHLIH